MTRRLLTFPLLGTTCCHLHECRGWARLCNKCLQLWIPEAFAAGALGGEGQPPWPADRTDTPYSHHLSIAARHSNRNHRQVVLLVIMRSLPALTDAPGEAKVSEGPARLGPPGGRLDAIALIGTRGTLRAAVNITACMVAGKQCGNPRGRGDYHHITRWVVYGLHLVKAFT